METYARVDSRSAGQEIPRLLWTQEVHYRVHKIPPLDPILTQMDSLHTFPSYFSKFSSNILPSRPRSSEWSLPSSFPTNISYEFLIYPMRATCTAHLILLVKFEVKRPQEDLGLDGRILLE